MAFLSSAMDSDDSREKQGRELLILDHESKRIRMRENPLQFHQPKTPPLRHHSSLTAVYGADKICDLFIYA